jgi:chromosome segregation ATPase
MAEWTTVNLNEVVKILKRHYPDDEFTVGVDKANMVYYVVPTRLGLDASIPTVKESLAVKKVMSAIGSEGFPRSIMIWLEEEEGGLLEELDIQEIVKEEEEEDSDPVVTKASEKDLKKENKDLKKQVKKLEKQVESKGGGGDDDMEYLVAELAKLRETNKELEEKLKEKGSGKDKKAKDDGPAEIDPTLITMYEEMGGDVSELSGDASKQTSAICEYIKINYETVESDLTAQEERIIELEKQVEGGDEEDAGKKVSGNHGEGKCVSVKEHEKAKKDLGFELESLKEKTEEIEKANAEFENTILDLREKKEESDTALKGKEKEMNALQVFFGEEVYDKEFAKKAVSVLSDLGISPQGFGISKLKTVTDANGEKKYPLPLSIVELAKNYDDIKFLEGKLDDLQKQVDEQSTQAEDLDRKITTFKEEEATLSKKVTEEKAELAELDVILAEFEKSGLTLIREKINKLLKLKESGSDDSIPTIDIMKPEDDTT